VTNPSPGADDRQTAIRLLACINAGCTPVSDGSLGKDVIGVLRGQSKLQALDFWMRYPDYLANELINEYETTGTKEYLEIAEQIFESREPELRRLPMLRYLFGAFEPLDNALACLRAVDIIRIRREGAPGKVREHLYLLTRRGRDSFERLAASAPEIAWYKERAAIVSKLAGDKGGKALKDRQYLQQEYAETDINSIIEPVTERVRERIRKVKMGQPQ
jgi:hypothetical protein